MRPQRLAVGQQEVEGPCFAICGASSRSVSVSSATLGTPACDLAISCMIQQKARSLSVLPTGRKLRVQARMEVLQVAVVREHPVAAPQLAHEGVAVLQRHSPCVALRMCAITLRLLIG
jgi:hypothetical protein